MVDLCTLGYAYFSTAHAQNGDFKLKQSLEISGISKSEILLEIVDFEISYIRFLAQWRTPRYISYRIAHNIDWPTVRWEDLRKPLYSGLAARLKLSNVKVPIPLASEIEEQGQYWKDYYNSKLGAGTVEKFVEDVEALRSLK